ncbi:hypothetical protein [Flavobacterium sp. UBA7680]|uniref:hypothetical protein n=1 Tax=Flavobacterium sp. UBA7680 TaxID=1946559 RepID=UPI0025C62B0A|nr:hypothetical protein [Flavobacterium sp. UBA7680]
MNDSLKNIINFSSTLNAQLKASEKFSNIIKTQSSFIKSSEAFNKIAEINLRVNQTNDIFSRYQNLAKSIDLNSDNISSPLKIIKSLNSGGMSGNWNALQEFVRSQKYFEKINTPFYLSITPKYREISISDSWEHFVPKLGNIEFGNLKFHSSFKNLEHYETLQSFAEYDIAKNRLLKDEISKKVEKVLSGSISYTDDYSSLYQSASVILDRDYARRQQSLENLKNYIINGDFDFNYTVGLENFIWNYFSKIEELEETIDYSILELTFIKIIISLSVKLNKSQLDKRDFFRKINSFHFKNLDDEYHSYSLTA